MNEVNKIFNNNRHYIVIGILSLIAVFFLPMLGSDIGLGFNIPNTFAGWVVYIITKCCIVTINLLIFDQFIKRAKVNVKDNPKFIEAENILNSEIDYNEKIIPAEILIKKMYKNKMTTTAIFTILGVFGFTNAILTFDWVSMLSYTFTIIMGLVFGWIAMGDAEIIWIENHYKYAKKIEKERIIKKQTEETLEKVEGEIPQKFCALMRAHGIPIS